MLMDKYLKAYEFSEYHETEIMQAPAVIFPLIRTTSFHRSQIIRTLFLLRGLSPRMDTLNGFMECGFILLEEVQGEELVIGFLLGKRGMKKVQQQEFVSFNDRKYVKGVCNFRISRRSNRVYLSTETRVHCSGARKALFALYWMLISGFSAITRQEMLRLIKREAEAMPRVD